MRFLAKILNISRQNHLRSASNVLTVLALVCLIVFLSGFFRRQNEFKVEDLTFKYHSAAKGDTESQFHYDILYFPHAKKNEKFPILMLMHGLGEKGDAYINFWEKTAAKHRIMLVAPTRGGSEGFGPEHISQYSDLMKEVMRNYPVDSKKVYLFGFSAGSVFAKWMMMADPNLWKKVVSGGTQTGEHWMKGKNLSSYPPILYVHGAKDGGTVAAEIAEHAKWVREAGGHADVMIDQKAGHEYKREWNEAIADWLLKGEIPPSKI